MSLLISTNCMPRLHARLSPNRGLYAYPQHPNTSRRPTVGLSPYRHQKLDQGRLDQPKSTPTTPKRSLQQHDLPLSTIPCPRITSTHHISSRIHTALCSLRRLLWFRMTRGRRTIFVTCHSWICIIIAARIQLVPWVRSIVPHLNWSPKVFDKVRRWTWLNRIQV